MNEENSTVNENEKLQEEIQRLISKFALAINKNKKLQEEIQLLERKIKLYRQEKAST